MDSTNDRGNGDNLFVPIAAKMLASETDDDNGGGGDDDDPMQIHGDRLLIISKIIIKQ